jgi:hypothetical protein
LSGASSYPAITVTVNLSATAPGQLTNQASVSGGGGDAAGAEDLTVIGALSATPAGMVVHGVSAKGAGK